MLQRLEIENYRGLRALGVPMRPLTVLVGPNDTGKSTFLAAIKSFINRDGFAPTDRWRGTGNIEVRIAATVDGVVIERVSISDKMPVRERYSVSDTLGEPLVRSLSPLGFFELPSQGVAIEAVGTPDNVGPPELDARGTNTPALIDYLLRRDRKRFDQLTSTLCRLVPGLEDVNVTTPIPDRRQIQFIIEHGYPIDANAASVGLRVLLFYVALAYHPEPPKTILIEEPETGVHPKRLADVMNLLREITQGKHGGHAAQVILTTHSPYLLDLVNLDTDQVLVFKRNDDGSRTAEPADAERLKTFLDEFMLGEVWFNEGEAGLVARKTP